MVTHRLKVHPQFLPALTAGEKPFEIRKDDRNFAVGDTLALYGWDPEMQREIGWEKSYTITYKLTGAHWGVMEGYCVLGIKPYKPKCTTCDDTGVAAYPERLCGDCDAGKEKKP